MMTPWGRTNRSAFTLLEMLLVMTVIVMAAGLIIAGVDGLREVYRLPRAADDLRGMLAGLRARAMDEAVVFEFSFEAGANKYRIKKAGDNAGGSHGAPSDIDVDPAGRVEFDADIFGEHELAAGLTLERGRAEASKTVRNDAGDARNAQRVLLRFLPDGSCTGLAFTLKDASGGQVDFHVRALTGAIKMSRKSSDGREIAP